MWTFFFSYMNIKIICEHWQNHMWTICYDHIWTSCSYMSLFIYDQSYTNIKIICQQSYTDTKIICEHFLNHIWTSKSYVNIFFSYMNIKIICEHWRNHMWTICYDHIWTWCSYMSRFIYDQSYTNIKIICQHHIRTLKSYVNIGQIIYEHQNHMWTFVKSYMNID